MGMGKYRTAQGKVVDMAALAAKNEKMRAVGNMKVNARGDTIDSHGKVILPVTQKVSSQYQKTVTNRQANVRKAGPVPISKKNTKPVVEEVLTEEEKSLGESFDDVEIEEIKKKETQKK